MIIKKDNILTINRDTILFFIVVLAAVLLFCPSLNKSVKVKTNPHSVVESLQQKSGDVSSGLRITIYQRTWITNKDKYKLLSCLKGQGIPEHTPIQKVSPAVTARREPVFIPALIFRYHLFPDETGEDPGIG